MWHDRKSKPHFSSSLSFQSNFHIPHEKFTGADTEWHDNDHNC